MKTFPSRPLLMMVLLASCQSNEIGLASDVNPETVYQDFEISYEEGNDHVNCTAQFRFAGVNGTTLVLDEKGKIELDDHELQVDSSDANGAFYQSKPLMNQFAGEHEFRYTDTKGHCYKNVFTFTPFTCALLPDSVRIGDLKLNFTGLADHEPLQVSLADTAFESNDLDSLFLLKDQTIVIPAIYLQKMKPGPLILQVAHTKTIDLKHAAKEGGILSYAYVLKSREIILVPGKINSSLYVAK